jgi:plasmid stability protein
MAQLVVRNLENDVKAKLQQRARRHKRSTEEEVREILRHAVREDDERGAQSGLGTRIGKRFAKTGLGKGEDIPEQRGFPAHPADFEP